MGYKSTSKRTLLFIGSIFTILCCNLSLAGTGEKYANVFFWAHGDSHEVLKAYTPMSPYSMIKAWENTTGSSAQRENIGSKVDIVRWSTGTYIVRLHDFDIRDGVTHLTPYGGSHFCKPYSPLASAEHTVIYVKCYGNDGKTKNGKFTFQYFRSGSSFSYNEFGHAEVNEYNKTLNSTYSVSKSQLSSGNKATVKRTATGQYTVHFKGVEVYSSSMENAVLVTALGSGANICSVGAGLEGDKVHVTCFGADGKPVNSRFNISVGEPSDAGAEYASDRLKAATEFSLAPLYSSSSPKIERIAKGQFRADFYGLVSSNRSTANVSTWVGSTSYPSNWRVHCNIKNWGPNWSMNNTTSVYVNCYDSNGNLSDGGSADSYFVMVPMQVSYFTNKKL